MAMRGSGCELQAHARGNPRGASTNNTMQCELPSTYIYIPKRCLRERIPVQVWSLSRVANRHAEGCLKTVHCL